MWTERQKFWYSLKTHGEVNTGIFLHIVVIVAGALIPGPHISDTIIGLVLGFLVIWPVVLIDAFMGREMAYLEYLERNGYDTKN